MNEVERKRYEAFQYAIVTIEELIKIESESGNSYVLISELEKVILKLNEELVKYVGEE